MQTRALTLGIAAGALGAAVWAAIVYFAALEIGWIAWGIGLLVGVAVLFGNEGHKTKTAGMAAAIIATLSVVVGKYAAVKAFVSETDDVVAETVQELNTNDELLISYVADEIIGEMEIAGQVVNWPGDTLPMEPTAEAHYPADVWTVALTRWDSMGTQGQQQFREETVANLETTMAMFQDMVVQEGFRESFGGMDLIFFGLAIVTAFQIAGGKEKEPAPEPAQPNEPSDSAPPPTA